MRIGHSDNGKRTTDRAPDRGTQALRLLEVLSNDSLVALGDGSNSYADGSFWGVGSWHGEPLEFEISRAPAITNRTSARLALPCALR